MCLSCCMYVFVNCNTLVAIKSTVLINNILGVSIITGKVKEEEKKLVISHSIRVVV